MTIHDAIGALLQKMSVASRTEACIRAIKAHIVI
jgi:hypothetical protein